MKTALQKEGYQFRCGTRVTEIKPELKGVQPRGWPSGSTWDACEGFQDPGKKWIAVTETHKPIGGKNFLRVDEWRRIGVLNHETGHAFNTTYSQTKVAKKIPASLYSDTPKFATAYTKDVQALRLQGGTIEGQRKMRDVQYFMQSGSAGRDETFAECVSKVLGRQAASSSYAGMAENFPNSLSYVKELFK